LKTLILNGPKKREAYTPFSEKGENPAKWGDDLTEKGVDPTQ